MQKVLRRTALAKSQAKRKARVHAEKKTSIENVQAKSVTAGIHREHLQAEREARQMRRDDWEMGPLAPWRDYAAAGSLKHGSWNARLMNPAPVPKEWRMKVCFFKVGDRVAVVEGKEGIKGRIGKLRSIERETETCIVEGVNRLDIRLPSAVLRPGQPPLTTTEAPIPLSSLRLVYPLPDPITGTPRDCILTNLTQRNTRYDVYTNEDTFDRILMPQNLRIPWPDRQEPSGIDEPCDTLRIDVESKTFLPTLLRPPMPPSVLDEVRGKYSKFRERHETEWVARKKVEDEDAVRVRTLGAGMKPKGARNVARGEHAGSAGGKFLETKRLRPKDENRNLEAVGAWMAERGLGKTKKAMAVVESGAQDPTASMPPVESETATPA